MENITAQAPKQKVFKDYLEFQRSQKAQAGVACLRDPAVKPRPSLEAYFAQMEDARQALDEAMKKAHGEDSATEKLQKERRAIQKQINDARAEKKISFTTLKGDELQGRLLELNTSLEVLEHQLAEKDGEITRAAGVQTTPDALRALRGAVTTAEGAFYAGILEELREALPKVPIVQVIFAAAEKANWAGDAGVILAELMRGYRKPGTENWHCVRKDFENHFKKGERLW